MALRALQGPTGGGAPVGGTGTSSPSTIPRWTGPSTLGDSGLIDNGTAIYTTARDRFGIGIATPDQGLHVLSPNNATTSGGQVTQQNFNGVSNQKWMTSVGGGDNVWVNGRGWFLRDMTAGATRLVCDTSGNVGIGTASPKDLLHVSGGSIKVGADAINSFLSFGDEGVTTRNNGIYRPASSNTLTIGSYNLITFNVSTAALGSQTERARIDSAGRLLVGTSTAASITSVRSIIASASDTYLQFADTALSRGGLVGTISGGIGLFTYTGAIGSETYALRALAGSSSLDISQTSGYGLKLQGTAGTNNTDPNVLDFYADGGTANSGGVTWTPTLKFGGNTTGITYATQVGRYTRIGNMVFASGYIILSSKGTAVGNATIDGLPAASTLANLYSSASISYLVNVTFASQPVGYIGPGATWINLTQNVSGGASSSLTNAEFTNTSAIIFSIAYSVN